MEKDKNNKSLYAIIGILLILLIALGGYLIYDKVLSSNNNSIDNSSNASGINRELYRYELGDLLNTEFKIHQIDKVFVVTSTSKGKQCNWSDVLIYNASGTKLKEYKYAYVKIENDIITLDYVEDGKCLSSGENSKTIKYQVVDSNITIIDGIEDTNNSNVVETDNNIITEELTIRTYRFFGYTTDSSPDMYTTLKLYSNNKYDLYVNNCEGVDKYSGNYVETNEEITLNGNKNIVFEKKNNGNLLDFNFSDLGACHNSGGSFSLESSVLER